MQSLKNAVPFIPLPGPGKPPFNLTDAAGASTAGFADNVRDTQRILDKIEQLRQEIASIPQKIVDLEKERSEVYDEILKVEEHRRVSCPSK